MRICSATKLKRYPLIIRSYTIAEDKHSLLADHVYIPKYNPYQKLFTFIYYFLFISKSGAVNKTRQLTLSCLVLFTAPGGKSVS